MNELRAIRRNRILRGGKILLNNKHSVIDCSVRNLSDDGACLQVASIAGIPRAFDLLIDGDGASRPCELVWQSANRIGVSFQSPPAPEHSAASQSNA
jgi:PilZ domain